MDNQFDVYKSLRAFGMNRQEIEKGKLKIRIPLKGNHNLA